MAKYVLKTHEELVDFVQGCLLYGVGGGGNPEEGLKALEEQMAAGNELSWVDAGDLPAGSWVACAFLMGSTAPLTPDKLELMGRLGLKEWTYPRNLAKTTEFLEEYTGRKISALVPLELGGSNTPVPMAAAAALGKAVINGEFAGRAVPEITQAVPVGKGVSFTPATSFDKWGNKSIIVDTINMDMAERLGKLIADASFGSTGLCGFMIPAEEIKDNMVAGTMAEAMKAGRALRQAKVLGKDAAEALCSQLGMYDLFRGTVKEKPWEDRDGYYWGTHVLEGRGAFAGHQAEVVFKNENQLFYLDGRLAASSPDLIINLDTRLGQGRRNEDVQIGDELAILGLPCKPELRAPAMLKSLEPRHFGVDAPYIPIEELQKK
ncbi:MAG: DUF917 domain-containing protein [Peptococcaceae bacterium]|nr:DUF917 domain-containing protein [Peptococcaceae bacterium]